MRILRIYPFLPPLPGGLEKHVLRLTEEQRRLDCEVTVAFNRGEATAPGDIRILPRIDLRMIRPQALRDLVFYLALAVRLLIRRERFDVAHVHGDWSAFLLGRVVAACVRARLHVASFHGAARRRRPYRQALAGYDVVYATGARDAAVLAAHGRCPVHWQPSGIDELFLRNAPVDAVRCDIVSVGSFVPVKNLALIVDIAAALPDVSFLLVGDGPTRVALEADCRQRGLDNITFAGRLAPEDVARRLRSARIFLMTSREEGTPTSLLEAMACGLAIVTSRSNDYDELLQSGNNGYIINSFVVGDYAAPIRALLAEPRRLEVIAGRNRELAAAYAWPRVAARITAWMDPDAARG